MSLGLLIAIAIFIGLALVVGVVALVSAIVTGIRSDQKPKVETSGKNFVE